MSWYGMCIEVIVDKLIDDVFHSQMENKLRFLVFIFGISEEEDNEVKNLQTKVKLKSSSFAQ
jgi:hypothetical protein